MEEILAAPSEDNGNVPLETPSEPEKIETPAKVETVQPTEPELFALPDGRKVDGETLAKEFKENFLPEFTRKSQELADLKKGKTETTTINETTKPYTDPNWQPKSWQEAFDLAQQETLAALEARKQAEVDQRKAVEDAVVTQLTELKTSDPTLNENALFLHANKYGFTDLKVAHQNMKDMAELAKKVQTTTAQNIAKRNDPVSTTQGAATGAKPNPSNFGTAVDFLRSLK